MRRYSVAAICHVSSPVMRRLVRASAIFAVIPQTSMSIHGSTTVMIGMLGQFSRSEGGMRLQRRRFSEPSDVRTIPRGRIDIVELDDTVVGRMTYEPGWRWSVDVKPIAGTDTCQYHHLGVTQSGRLRAQMADGTELEVGPGDIFEIPPGHDAWVVGDEPWISVDFEAMRTYGKQRDQRDERILASIV
ncbi:MAG: cupin domain-containing protein, partial [Chloroflexi bacterium]|nr:cupin domain-containing protein [Chloroflexota bacterium]